MYELPSEVKQFEPMKILDYPKATHQFRLADGDYLVFQTSKAPNKFHQWMQRLLLGIHWEKI